MKALFNTINRFISTKPKSPMYGRFSLDYERSIQDRKVYLNNMDHCGCCGNIITNIKSKFDNIEKNNESNKTSTEDELLPYIL